MQGFREQLPDTFENENFHVNFSHLFDIEKWVFGSICKPVLSCESFEVCCKVCELKVGGLVDGLKLDLG